MLAHRVVLRRGLELEPEEWLASIDEEAYRNWEAYFRLEPTGGEEVLLARICNQLSLLVAAKFGSEDSVLKVQDLLPVDWAWRKPEPTSEEGIAAVQRKLEAGA